MQTIADFGRTAFTLYVAPHGEDDDQSAAQIVLESGYEMERIIGSLLSALGLLGISALAMTGISIFSLVS